MALTASGLYVNDKVIASAVKEIEKRFAPDVVRIGYTIGDNFWGDPSVFYRVLVRDETAKPVERLGDLANRLSVAMMNAVNIEETPLSTYFNYRTVSEQETLQDPNWN